MALIILVASGTLAGYMESRRLSIRVEQLESFLRFLSAAQTEIRFAALPVEQIVQRHSNELEFLEICGEKCSEGDSFYKAWEKGIKGGTRGHGLKSQDIDLFYGFGKSFGASDADGQISHCTLYAELINDNLKSAREEKNQKSRLYQILGVFSGMAAALLMC
jgi:stage III sporulation protein AB